MEPQERHYDVNKLNIIFAISSCVLLVTLLWMLAQDYAREWKDYQRAFRALEIEKTRVKYDAAIHEAKDREEYRALEDQLKGAREALAKDCQAEAKAQEQKKVSIENDLLNQQYRFAKAEHDAARYRLEIAQANHESYVREAQKEFERLGRTVSQLKLAVEQSDQKLAELQKATEICSSQLVELERKERSLLQKANILERKLAKIDPNGMNLTNRIADIVRDLPIIDLANPNYKIEQVVVKDITEDLIFAKVPEVDRCLTCHMGISNPDYKDAPQPFTTHPNLGLYLGNESAHPLEEFGCTVCHGGRGRGTDFISTAHTPSSVKQAEEWEKKYDWYSLPHWEKSMLPMPSVEAGCFQCHGAQTTIKGAEKLNLGLNIIERAGCYACHEIDRYQDWPKPGPDLTKLSSKISRQWAYRWIESPQTFHPNTWMPTFFKQSNNSNPQYLKRTAQEIHAMVAYLFAHSQEYPLTSIPVDGDIQKGKEIVSAVGCLACHRIEPRPVGQPMTQDTLRREQGPSLSGLGSKTSKAWLYNWLKNPHGYNSKTKMPNMRLSDEEAADAAAYLMSLRNDIYDTVEIPAIDETTLNEIVLDFLKKSETFNSAQQKLTAMNRETKLTYAGEELIRHYGCFSCHDIAGFADEKPIGVELTEEGSKSVERLDFGFVPIDHTRQAWFAQKLKDPRIFDSGKVKPYDEQLRMPNFYLSNEAIGAVTTALLGFVHETPEAKIVPRTPQRLKVERGEEIVRMFNCQGCHTIEGEGGSIQSTIKDWLVAYNDVSENEAGAMVASFSPPNLIGEGKKVQAQWLFNFMHQPTTIRPWLKVRMPTYGLGTQSLNDLVQYFGALDNQDSLFEHKMEIPSSYPDGQWQAGERLFSKDYFDCAKCHIIGSQMPRGSPENWAPDFALAKARLRPGWIEEWLENPQELLPGTKMPTYFDPDNFDTAGPEDILGGDERQQIRALRDYLMTLTDKTPTQPTAPPP